MKLEACSYDVGNISPTFSLATVVATVGSRILLHFDGAEPNSDIWRLPDSGDIHPVGWTEGSLLKPPMSKIWIYTIYFILNVINSRFNEDGNTEWVYLYYYSLSDIGSHLLNQNVLKTFLYCFIFDFGIKKRRKKISHCCIVKVRRKYLYYCVTLNWCPRLNTLKIVLMNFQVTSMIIPSTINILHLVSKVLKSHQPDFLKR